MGVEEKVSSPPSLRGWCWVCLHGLPGVQDGVHGSAHGGWDALPEGFQAAQGCEGGIRELSEGCLQ